MKTTHQIKKLTRRNTRSSYGHTWPGLEKGANAADHPSDVPPTCHWQAKLLLPLIAEEGDVSAQLSVPGGNGWALEHSQSHRERRKKR